MSLLDFRKKPGEPGAEPKPKLDEYERTVKELNFETRCVRACVCVCARAHMRVRVRACKCKCKCTSG